MVKNIAESLSVFSAHNLRRFSLSIILMLGLLTGLFGLTVGRVLADTSCSPTTGQATYTFEWGVDTEFRVFVNGVDKGSFRTIQINDYWGLTIPIGPANTAYKIEVIVDGEKVGEYNVICPSPTVGQSQTSEQPASSTDLVTVPGQGRLDVSYIDRLNLRTNYSKKEFPDGSTEYFFNRDDSGSHSFTITNDGDGTFGLTDAEGTQRPLNSGEPFEIGRYSGVLMSSQNAELQVSEKVFITNNDDDSQVEIWEDGTVKFYNGYDHLTFDPYGSVTRNVPGGESWTYFPNDITLIRLLGGMSKYNSPDGSSWTEYPDGRTLTEKAPDQNGKDNVTGPILTTWNSVGDQRIWYLDPNTGTYGTFDYLWADFLEVINSCILDGRSIALTGSDGIAPYTLNYLGDGQFDGTIGDTPFELNGKGGEPSNVSVSCSLIPPADNATIHRLPPWRIELKPDSGGAVVIVVLPFLGNVRVDIPTDADAAQAAYVIRCALAEAAGIDKTNTEAMFRLRQELADAKPKIADAVRRLAKAEENLDNAVKLYNTPDSLFFAKDLDAAEKARNDARTDQFHAFLDVYELTQSLNISSALDPGSAAIATMADQIVDGLNLSG